MRLRYAHFPRCGPLVNVSINFGQEKMLYGYSPDNPAKRKGAINFVVGVNGTGKSSLLRTLYQSFRALKADRLPGSALTLAWDREKDLPVTCLLHCPDGDADKKPWFGVFSRLDEFESPLHWQTLVNRQEKFLEEHPEIHRLHYVGDGNEITTSLLQAHLPHRLVAYTSGAELLWDSLEHPTLNTSLIPDGTGEREDDRPPGWTIEQEWGVEQPARLRKVMERLEQEIEDDPIPGASTFASIKPETAHRVFGELAPMTSLRRQVVKNQLLRAGKVSDQSFRVRSRELRLGAVAMGLWQAARELKGKHSQSDREALRKTLLEQRAKDHPGDDARRVFNALDWFWPTHLSFTYHDPGDRIDKRQHEQLLNLLALADEVTAQPRERNRVVISLGPIARMDFRARLEEVYPDGITSATLDLIADRVQGTPTGAEAVMRVFSSNKDLDTTLVEVFEELRTWQQLGLLEEITLTIKRLNRVTSADGELDDAVVTYDQFSDGEQMLMGRMALLFLLRRQDGTLLLLDEPETHFNDVWKREMIDLIDDAILKTTAAQIIVATHTSIALTDVFPPEITVLERKIGSIEAVNPNLPTFGEDPSEIMIRLFNARDNMGRRAAEFLDALVRRQWQPQDRAELEEILGKIGAGYYRSELRAALKKLDDAASPPTSA
jgi:predicted ATPase